MVSVGDTIVIDMTVHGVQLFTGVVTGVYVDWAGALWIQYDYTNPDGEIIPNEVRADFVREG